jgi:chromosomal replication initiation ATPase DnaA
MAEQLILDLPHRVAMGRDDFLVSAANAEAVAGIDDWRGWTHGSAVLVGPEASGKTHLAHVWAEMSGARVIAAAALNEAALDRLIDAPAVVVEDAERRGEDAGVETRLFHLMNAQAGGRGHILLTARSRPAAWGLRLPDLASRAAQARLLPIGAPDDGLLAAVMVKLAADRGLSLAPEAVSYALMRCERSFAAIADLVHRLDRAAVTRQKAPNRALLKTLLEPGDPGSTDPGSAG